MAPNITSTVAPVDTCEKEIPEERYEQVVEEKSDNDDKPKQYKIDLVWRNIIIFASLHIMAIYGTYLIFTSAKLATTIFAIFYYEVGTFGVGAGCHRLWSHKAYKAKWPLKLMLMIFQTISYQNSILEWSRDHRVHHKYSETDADPLNARRGFFFAHVGWLLCRKHPDVKKKGSGIDLSDLTSDPFVAFQDKYYFYLMPVLCFVVPTVVPMYFWNETFANAWFVATIWRYVLTLHGTWFVNSAAHLWGHRPYDKSINPAENLFVAIFSLGEGWHNYHHVFPWDYKTAELGRYHFNCTTLLINMFAKIGWAYDMKTVSDEFVKKRVMRTGDGSHPIWGWGDKDQTKEHFDNVITLNPEKPKSL